MEYIEAFKLLEKLEIILKAASDIDANLTISSKDCKKFYEALFAIFAHYVLH